MLRYDGVYILLTPKMQAILKNLPDFTCIQFHEYDELTGCNDRITLNAVEWQALLHVLHESMDWE